MTAISTFANTVFGSIRVVKAIDDEPRFCLSDVCDSLELSAKGVRQRLSDEVISNYPIIDSLGRTQQALFVNEDGLYDVILDSRKPEAKAFRKWITSEVLPSIRKSGGYMYTNGTESPDDLMARAILLANETIQRSQRRIQEQEQQIADLAPKALFADAVATSSDSILVAELARFMSQNGVDIGQNRLFDWMRKNGYLCSKGELYNQPTQKAMDLKLFEVKKTSITKPDGTVLVSSTTKVTGKGSIYFLNKFLNLNN